MQSEQAPKHALPLLVLLGLASALGVTVAIALAGLAMLLAASAYAGEGALFLERRAGMAQAPVLYAETESREEGMDVRTRVLQAYHNPFDEPLVGVYLYRFKHSAVVERLTFTLEAAEPRAALLTRRQAVTLIERTAEIRPGETLQVELEYRTRAPRRVLALGGKVR